MTRSEEAFEELLHRFGYEFDRIEEGDERSPDYCVHTPSGDIVCEIKQFELNADEQAALGAAIRGEAKVVSSTPGARVRSAISDSNGQLKQYTRKKFPGILVVCDTALFQHAGDYNIRVAMYGLDAIYLGIPKDINISPYVRDRGSGGKRRMTEDHCTTISAVADLKILHQGTPELDIYLNKFAAMPLTAPMISGKGVRYFRLREKDFGQFDAWEQIWNA